MELKELKMSDFLKRMKYRFLLWFTRDKEKRKCLLICIALCSTEGREVLAEAMIQPLRRKKLLDVAMTSRYTGENNEQK